MFLVRFGPGQRGEPHWHPSDTLYIFHAGSLTVEGEATYGAGEVRFVRGGFADGAEVGGPDGCEFVFVSLGVYGRFDPDLVPPPRGRWDDTPGQSSLRQPTPYSATALPATSIARSSSGTPAI